MMRTATLLFNHPTLNQGNFKSKMLTYATAAVLTTISSSTVDAFQIARCIHTRSACSKNHLHPIPIVNLKLQSSGYKYSSSRLFFSRDNSKHDNDGEGKSLFGKMKNLVPSFLKPEDEKSQLTRREQAKDQVSSSIDTMLKDAPLGVRMMGKMISPIISSAVGSLAEVVEEQSHQMSEILDDTRMYCIRSEYN